MPDPHLAERVLALREALVMRLLRRKGFHAVVANDVRQVLKEHALSEALDLLYMRAAAHEIAATNMPPRGLLLRVLDNAQSFLFALLARK